jgi:multicomponent Na+:H+ antiporter subunit D
MMSNASFFHPAILFFLGLLVIPYLKGVVRQIFILVIPVVALTIASTLTPGTFGVVEIGNITLTFGRVDKLSLVFANIFTLMAVIGAIYGLHLKEPWEHVAAWGYVGSAIGCTFAGDYLTLFLFWEGLMVSSACLIFLRKTAQSRRAGLRYFLVHTTGGLILLAGIFLLYHETGDLSFVTFKPEEANLAVYLILIGFLLNAAVPPLHAWLPDAYGSATVVGSVFMCAYTTKTAVYTLIRGFAGFEILIPLGVCMALYGVVFAVLENDARRLLSYHIISQVGYMVAGTGIGTALAINGACAHAYAHILYKSLLFMGVGSVLYVTGRSKFTELGGLWRSMPWTFVFTLVGGLSISAFPLFSGFVMLAAMALASLYCIMIGCFPGRLYNMLPYPVDYNPYTPGHVMQSYQILLFTMLGFFLLIKKLKPEPKIALDLDWFYRRSANLFMSFCRNVLRTIEDSLVKNLHSTVALPLLRGLSTLSYWHDRRVIDQAVDGSAHGVLLLGNRLRVFLQPGRISRYVAYMLTVLATFIFISLIFTF